MLTAIKDEKLREGVFYDSSKFQMKNYVEKWKEKVLNADGKLAKFGELNSVISNDTKKWFIRPNSDGKEFSGKVDTFGNIKKWSDKVCKLDLIELNKETLIWISEPKEIDKEWRIFIVDNEIISACRYMVLGKLDECENDIPEEMIKFTEDRIGEYQIEDIYVMDIAQVGKDYKIIECNCFNGTGFYKHDIESVIKSVNKLIKGKIKRKTCG